MLFLDCTLRDGGYYNSWDFGEPLIAQYLAAMRSVGVDAVELGLRSLKNVGFKGACAFTTDEFLSGLQLPDNLKIGVMINASELPDGGSIYPILNRLFPRSAVDSPVDLVRIACHFHEVSCTLPAVTWLKQRGYEVGVNLMQIADRSEGEIKELVREICSYPVDVLYFADSMGSMGPEQTANIVRWLRSEWGGALGIHTHDNLGLALSNSIRALDEGVTWVDSTVTGMGRGPGNARTEELAIEIGDRRGTAMNMVPLMKLIREHFGPLQKQHGWGTNPFYYLSGKYGIHPTYIQEMLNDSRYSDEDMLAVIEHLRHDGGKKYSPKTLDVARYFYQGEPKGGWQPKSVFAGRDVLLLGTGPGVARHRQALESYIIQHKPIVLALNTQSAIDASLIDLRVACHPVRLLADCEGHARLPQPLITPYSMLPKNVQEALAGKEILDFGLQVRPNIFSFQESHCAIPSSLVLAYALAVATSGLASRIILAGFDGYPGEDARNAEGKRIFAQYQESLGALPLVCVTPSRYDLDCQSVYGSLHD